MDYMRVSYDIAESELRINRKQLKNNYIWLLVIFGAFIVDILNLYFFNRSWIVGLSIGITGIVVLFIWLSIWETRNDIKYNKENLKLLEKHRENENLKGAIKQLERAKEYYNNLIIANAAFHESKPQESESPTAES